MSLIEKLKQLSEKPEVVSPDTELLTAYILSKVVSIVINRDSIYRLSVLDTLNEKVQEIISRMLSDEYISEIYEILPRMMSSEIPQDQLDAIVHQTRYILSSFQLDVKPYATFAFEGLKEIDIEEVDPYALFINFISVGDIERDTIQNWLERSGIMNELQKVPVRFTTENIKTMMLFDLFLTAKANRANTPKIETLS